MLHQGVDEIHIDPPSNLRFARLAAASSAAAACTSWPGIARKGLQGLKDRLCLAALAGTCKALAGARPKSARWRWRSPGAQAGESSRQRVLVRGGGGALGLLP